MKTTGLTLREAKIMTNIETFEQIELVTDGKFLVFKEVNKEMPSLIFTAEDALRLGKCLVTQFGEKRRDF